MAAPFDLRRLALTGEAIPVLDGVLQSQFTGAAHYSFSATGSLVYVPGGFQRRRTRLVWVDRNGAEQPLGAADGDYYVVRISPDGKRLALGIGDGIWAYDLARGTLTRLTFEGNANYIPIWTPDGKRVIFQSYRAGTARNLFWQLADGSGGLERLTVSEYTNTPFSFSPDGRLLAFVESEAQAQAPAIWVLRLDDRKAEPFLKTRFDETGPQFSPDGRWLAYVSNESGRFEVYVQPYPGPGGKSQISTEGGRQALWNPNGRELFYREGSKMMAVDVTTEPVFSAGKPKMLFDGPYLMTGAQYPNYDVAPDGQRFLMLKPVEEAQAAAQINVVLNWLEELKQRVPVR